MRKNVINKMRGGLDHAPRRAGRTDATPFAGVGNDKIVAAIGTAGAGKTVGENAAFEVATEFTFGKCRGASAISVVVLRQPGGQMRLHHAVKQRAFRLAPVVNRRHATRFGNCVRHEHPNRGTGEQIQPRLARQAKIQQKQFINTVGHRQLGSSTIAHPIDRIAVLLESALYAVTNHRIIFN